MLVGDLPKGRRTSTPYPPVTASHAVRSQGGSPHDVLLKLTLHRLLKAEAGR